jgi:hypothetical protein
MERPVRSALDRRDWIPSAEMPCGRDVLDDEDEGRGGRERRWVR